MKIFFTILLLVVFNNIFAQEIRSELSIVPHNLEYHEGELVEVDLKIWPIEAADLSEFKKLEGMNLFNSFEITNIVSMGISENNADVVLIKADAIILSAADKVTQAFSYKNNNISLTIPQFKFIPLKNKSEDFYVLDQSLKKKMMWLVWSVVFVLIMGLLFYFRKKLFSRKPKIPEWKKINNEMFLKAESRKDYEEIYARRREWVQYLVAETIAHREFFSVMEQHQYKKSWQDSEAEEVKNAFEIIRRSFS